MVALTGDLNNWPVNTCSIRMFKVGFELLLPHKKAIADSFQTVVQAEGCPQISILATWIGCMFRVYGTAMDSSMVGRGGPVSRAGPCVDRGVVDL
jgi:hypothetical protein